MEHHHLRKRAQRWRAAEPRVEARAANCYCANGQKGMLPMSDATAAGRATTRPRAAVDAAGAARARRGAGGRRAGGAHWQAPPALTVAQFTELWRC